MLRTIKPKYVQNVNQTPKHTRFNVQDEFDCFETETRLSKSSSINCFQCYFWHTCKFRKTQTVTMLANVFIDKKAGGGKKAFIPTTHYLQIPRIVVKIKNSAISTPHFRPDSGRAGSRLQLRMNELLQSTDSFHKPAIITH